MTNRSGLVFVEENNRLQQCFASSLLRRLQYSGKFQCLVIFIGMFFPKWARGPHKLARFPSWDSCITPGYWGQYFNALPSSEHCLIHSCPERSYTFVFCPLPSPPLNAYAALLPRGGYSQKNWVGVCGPLPKTLTLFMTKLCDFPYPIYDLTKNLIPYLWPDP